MVICGCKVCSDYTDEQRVLANIMGDHCMLLAWGSKVGGAENKGRRTVLSGEYSHQIDEKGRIRIPARLKADLGEGFICVKGTAGCLSLFPKKYWDENFAAKIMAVPYSDIEAQMPIRMFFSSASELEEDNQGRYLMPRGLRDYANIKKELVLIGVGVRAEIWAQEEYERYMNGEKRELSPFDKAIMGLQKYGV